MFGYVKILWPIIVGICLYAGAMHLQIGLRRPVDRIHTLFGVLALCAAFAIFGNIALTTVQTPHNYQIAAWYSTSIAPLVFIVLPIFLTFYAGERTHMAAYCLSGFFVVVLIGNLLQPYSMLLSGPPVLRQVVLPWGESITRSATAPSTWYGMVWIGYALTIGYVIYASIRLFVRGPRARAWGLVLSAGPFSATLLINILVGLHIVDFPFVAAPGFLAIVLVMSVALTREWRRAHLQMQALLDNVPAAAYLKQVDGRYTFVNRHFESLFNVRSADVLGKTDAQILDLDRAAAHAQAEQQALIGGRSIESEESIIKGQENRTYSTLRFALRDTDGDTYAICGITTDITERKIASDALRDLAVNLERRVARRTHELAQLNRELEAFAYSVSHDLRAPLTAVNGFAELLLREQGPKLDATANRYLTRIRDGSLRMAALIQDLLGLSRVTQQTIQRQVVDLVPMVESAFRPLREAEPARTVSLILPTSLPAQGDPQLLTLALNNLVTNAWKYTSKTTNPRIEIGSLEKDGDTVYFVKDNGAGFDPQYSDRLFRPFVRLHSEAEFPGTGIGLATVARIINRHGGRIWAEGKPNEGAIFYFTLPPPEEDTVAQIVTGNKVA